MRLLKSTRTVGVVTPTPQSVALDGLTRELLSGLQNRELEEEGLSLHVLHSARENVGCEYSHKELTKSRKTRHLLSFRSNVIAK